MLQACSISLSDMQLNTRQLESREAVSASEDCRKFQTRIPRLGSRDSLGFPFRGLTIHNFDPDTSQDHFWSCKALHASRGPQCLPGIDWRLVRHPETSRDDGLALGSGAHKPGPQNHGGLRNTNTESLGRLTLCSTQTTTHPTTSPTCHRC